jgi:tRNA (guanine-N7-)-methyltransferase
MLSKLSSLTLPWPTPWIELFGVDRPLILEIGFGYGAFLLHLARQNPNANIIGIEIANKCLTAVETAIERQKIMNIRVIHSTAETALHHLFQTSTINQVHINFPDPWFKKRHDHRRLMQRDTLDVIVNRLQPGGTFNLATDIIEYAAMSAELLAATPGLENTLPTLWVSSMPGRVTTKYEGRARRDGRNCYYFTYRRNHLPPLEIPVVRELAMPHVVFETPLTFDQMLAPFEVSEHKIGGTYINFLNGYRSKNALLFEVYIKEPTIDQHVALIVVNRENAGEYTLKLATLGHPRPTPGIHHAAAILGDWLVALHPQARILQRRVNEE